MPASRLPPPSRCAVIETVLIGKAQPPWPSLWRCSPYDRSLVLEHGTRRGHACDKQEHCRNSIFAA